MGDMSEIEIAWAAGLLEGEGCFRLKTGTNRPTIQVQMTDLDVLERLQSLFGGSIREMSKRKEHWKDCWVWYLDGKNAADTMKLVLPHMMSRRSEKIKSVLLTYSEHLRERQNRQNNRELAAQEYLSTDQSLRQIAKKYNMSYESVRRAVSMAV